MWKCQIPWGTTPTTRISPKQTQDTSGPAVSSGSPLSHSWPQCWSSQSTQSLPRFPPAWSPVTWLRKPWGSSSPVASLAKPTAGPCPEWSPPTARLPSKVLGSSEPFPSCPLPKTKRVAANGSSSVFNIKTAKHQKGSWENPTLYFSSHRRAFLTTHNPVPCTK